MSSKHDVLNVQAVDQFINRYPAQSVNPYYVRWFRHTLRRIILNDPQYSTPYDRNAFRRHSSYDPSHVDMELLQRKRLSDVEVRFFTYSDESELRRKLDHVIDYFRSLDESLEGAPHVRRAAERRMKGIAHLTTFETMKAASDEWFEWIQQRSLDEIMPLAKMGEEGGDIPLLDLDDGWRWVQLVSRGGLVREGLAMSHCVGTYHSRVQQGRTAIYSLRDSENQPHLTAEITNHSLIQMRGKENSEPATRYRKAIAAFIDYILTHHLVEDMPLFLFHFRRIEAADDYDAMIGRTIWASCFRGVRDSGEEAHIELDEPIACVVQEVFVNQVIEFFPEMRIESYYPVDPEEPLNILRHYRDLYAIGPVYSLTDMTTTAAQFSTTDTPLTEITDSAA